MPEAMFYAWTGIDTGLALTLFGLFLASLYREHQIAHARSFAGRVPTAAAAGRPEVSTGGITTVHVPTNGTAAGGAVIVVTPDPAGGGHLSPRASGGAGVIGGALSSARYHAGGGGGAHAHGKGRAIPRPSNTPASAPVPHQPVPVKRDYPYYSRRLGLCVSLAGAIGGIDRYGALEIFTPPWNDVVSAVCMGLGLLLGSIWLHFHVTVLFVRHRQPVPLWMTVSLYSLPPLCYCSMTAALIASYVIDRYWTVGLYNIFLSFTLLSYSCLGVACFVALRRVLATHITTMLSGNTSGGHTTDVSYLKASIRTLSIFVCVFVPVTIGMGALLLRRAVFHFTVSLPQQSPKQPPPERWIEQYSGTLVVLLGYLVVLLMWWYGFPPPANAHSTDSAHGTATVHPAGRESTTLPAGAIGGAHAHGAGALGSARQHRASSLRPAAPSTPVITIDAPTPPPPPPATIPAATANGGGEMKRPSLRKPTPGAGGAAGGGGVDPGLMIDVNKARSSGPGTGSTPNSATIIVAGGGSGRGPAPVRAAHSVRPGSAAGGGRTSPGGASTLGHGPGSAHSPLPLQLAGLGSLHAVPTGGGAVVAAYHKKQHSKQLHVRTLSFDGNNTFIPSDGGGASSVPAPAPVFGAAAMNASAQQSQQPPNPALLHAGSHSHVKAPPRTSFSGPLPASTPLIGTDLQSPDVTASPVRKSLVFAASARSPPFKPLSLSTASAIGGSGGGGGMALPSPSSRAAAASGSGAAVTPKSAHRASLINAAAAAALDAVYESGGTGAGAGGGESSGSTMFDFPVTKVPERYHKRFKAPLIPDQAMLRNDAKMDESDGSFYVTTFPLQAPKHRSQIMELRDTIYRMLRDAYADPHSYAHSFVTPAAQPIPASSYAATATVAQVTASVSATTTQPPPAAMIPANVPPSPKQQPASNATPRVTGLVTPLYSGGLSSGANASTSSGGGAVSGGIAVPAPKSMAPLPLEVGLEEYRARYKLHRVEWEPELKHARDREAENKNVYAAILKSPLRSNSKPPSAASTSGDTKSATAPAAADGSHSDGDDDFDVTKPPPATSGSGGGSGRGGAVKSSEFDTSSALWTALHQLSAEFYCYEVGIHELARQVATHSNERAALLTAILERVSILFQSVIPTAEAAMVHHFHELDNKYADTIAAAQKDLYKERIDWHQQKKALESEVERMEEEHKKKEAEWQQFQLDYDSYFKAYTEAQHLKSVQAEMMTQIDATRQTNDLLNEQLAEANETIRAVRAELVSTQKANAENEQLKNDFERRLGDAEDYFRKELVTLQFKYHNSSSRSERRSKKRDSKSKSGDESDDASSDDDAASARRTGAGAGADEKHSHHSPDASTAIDEAKHKELYDAYARKHKLEQPATASAAAASGEDGKSDAHTARKSARRKRSGSRRRSSRSPRHKSKSAVAVAPAAAPATGKMDAEPATAAAGKGSGAAPPAPATTAAAAPAAPTASGSRSTSPPPRSSRSARKSSRSRSPQKATPANARASMPPELIAAIDARVLKALADDTNSDEAFLFDADNASSDDDDGSGDDEMVIPSGIPPEFEAELKRLGILVTAASSPFFTYILNSRARFYVWITGKDQKFSASDKVISKIIKRIKTAHTGPKEWIVNFIWQVLVQKIDSDTIDDRYHRSRRAFPEFLYDLLLMQDGVDGAKRRAEHLALNVMKTAHALQHTDPLIALFLSFVEEKELPVPEPAAPAGSSPKSKAKRAKGAKASGGDVYRYDSDALNFTLSVLSSALTSDVGIEYGDAASEFGGTRWVCILRTRWINRTFFRAFGHASNLELDDRVLSVSVEVDNNELARRLRLNSNHMPSSRETLRKIDLGVYLALATAHYFACRAAQELQTRKLWLETCVEADAAAAESAPALTARQKAAAAATARDHKSGGDTKRATGANSKSDPAAAAAATAAAESKTLTRLADPKHEHKHTMDYSHFARFIRRLDSSLDSRSIAVVYGEVLRATPLHRARLSYGVFTRVARRNRWFEHEFTKSSALTPEPLHSVFERNQILHAVRESWSRLRGTVTSGGSSTDSGSGGVSGGGLVSMLASIAAERTPIGQLFVERVSNYEKRLNAELGFHPTTGMSRTAHRTSAAAAAAADPNGWTEQQLASGSSVSGGSARYAIKLYRSLIHEIYGFLTFREENGTSTVPPPPHRDRYSTLGPRQVFVVDELDSLVSAIDKKVKSFIPNSSGSKPTRSATAATSLATTTASISGPVSLASSTKSNTSFRAT